VWSANPHGDEHDDVVHGDVDEMEQDMTEHFDEAAEADYEARRRRSPLIRWGSLLVALAVVVVGGYFAVQAVAGMLPTFAGGGNEVEDYPGPGSGEIIVEVPEGAGGAEIAEVLAQNDVVASAGAFTAAAAVEPRSVSIQPGSYRMAEEMSAEGALDRMLDPEFREVDSVTVREGLWKEETFALLAEGTDHDVEDYEAVDPNDIGLPAAAGGEMEGYLFPDTYSFGADETPTQQLRDMVELGKTKYADLGLEGQELDTAIIKGSLIQAEGAFSDDLPKIARVIENRLEEDQPLGFDSTIHFIYSERGRAGTTNAQRESDSEYNTYTLTGLPPGPINSPGLAAIKAAMDPAKGPWLYFVTTNPDTGQTKFAVTFKEHKKNVQEFQRWCRNNRDAC